MFKTEGDTPLPATCAARCVPRFRPRSPCARNLLSGTQIAYVRTRDGCRCILGHPQRFRFRCDSSLIHAQRVKIRAFLKIRDRNGVPE